MADQLLAAILRLAIVRREDNYRKPAGVFWKQKTHVKIDISHSVV